MSFRVCSCGKEWASRDDFVGDPRIKVIGYQVNFEDLKEGFFLFNHLVPECMTTLAMPAGDFLDLYSGTIFQGRQKLGGEGCGGHCLHSGDIRPCPAKCECAFVRKVLNTVAEWPKRTSAA